jgi:hypothetical protein
LGAQRKEVRIMGRTCYDCGAENAESERSCHNCGADLWQHEGFHRSGLAAGLGEEHVLWDNGHMQLTTEALLIDMDTAEPDVVPLSSIADTEVRDECLVLMIQGRAERYCAVAEPEELEALLRDQMLRPRLAPDREDRRYVPEE